MSSKSKEFLKGIILADRTEMDAQTVQDFNRSGLVHFLAILGTIAFLCGLFRLFKILPLKFGNAFSRITVCFYSV
jgi:competence protein ComEC